MAVQIKITVREKNKVTEKKYECEVNSGDTLLQALQTYQKNNSGFKFQVKDDPDVGPYVISVNQSKEEVDKFWIPVLYYPAYKIVKPIDLDYKVNSSDDIHLLYKSF